MSRRTYEAVVIGGGVVGLSAAWHLLRLGCRPLALVERFRIGHAKGSSHGSVRMTRSTYASATYSALMRHVRAEEWPRLERDAGTALIHRADVLFFGSDRASLGAYAAAVLAAGADVERLTPAVARHRFPALRFADDAEILHDRTGGLIAAGDTLDALHRLIAKHGGDVLEDTRVLSIDHAGGPIRITTERGEFSAERVVIACGAWLRELVPAAAADVTVIPQTVAYVRLAAPARSLPAWVHFGGAETGTTYGLAEIGRDAFKIGHHVTRGAHVDPDGVASLAAGDGSALLRVVAQIVAVPVVESLGLERCLYTMTPTEDFVIDCWPGNPRVVFGSACSGHGFKFAPLTGRLLAELLVHGRAALPGGVDASSLFARRASRAGSADAGRTAAPGA